MDESPQTFDLKKDSSAVRFEDNGVLIGVIDYFEFQGHVLQLMEPYSTPEELRKADRQIGIDAVKLCLPGASLSDATAYSIASRLNGWGKSQGKG